MRLGQRSVDQIAGAVVVDEQTEAVGSARRGELRRALSKVAWPVRERAGRRAARGRGGERVRRATHSPPSPFLVVALFTSTVYGPPGLVAAACAPQITPAKGEEAVWW